jgi:hypothetical protein
MAPNPMAMVPDTGGGSHRLSVNSNAGANTESPTIARYERPNDNSWTLEGRHTAAMTKAMARTDIGFWGRSVATDALDIQNIITDLSTEGEPPTMYR